MSADCTPSQRPQEPRRAAGRSPAERWRAWLEAASATSVVMLRGDTPVQVDQPHGRPQVVAVFRAA